MTLPLDTAVPGGGERGGDVPGELLLLHPRHHPHLHGQDALHRPALLLQHLQVRPADLVYYLIFHLLHQNMYLYLDGHGQLDRHLIKQPDDIVVNE